MRLIRAHESPQTTMPNPTLTYDAQNRLTQAVHALNGTEQYGYTASRQRVWRKHADGSEEFFFYGAQGRMGTYKLINQSEYIGAPFGFLEKTIEVQFAGRRIWKGAATDHMSVDPATGIAQDRLGSTGSYFPCGEAKGTGGEMFATYRRDDATNLDYAMNRYYASAIGRFTTADPYSNSAGPKAPQSWNRYTHVLGDPINFTDRKGLNADQTTRIPGYCPPEFNSCGEWGDGWGGTYGGAGGFAMGNSAENSDRYAFGSLIRQKCFQDSYLECAS